MRRAGRVVGEILDIIEAEIRPGVSTAHLDALAEAHIREAGGDPVVQGLPGDQPAPAVPGQRLHLDRRRDRPRHPRRADDPRRPDRVGRRRRDRRRLARRRCADLLRRRAAGPGRPAHRPDPQRDDGRHRGGRAGQPHRGHLGRRRGRRREGEPRRHPPVRRPRHRDRDARGAAGPELPDRSPGPQARAGLCLAIEPMFTLGGYDTRIQPDDWTVVTADGSLAAHFEHSIAVTENGPQILTVA